MRKTTITCDLCKTEVNYALNLNLVYRYNDKQVHSNIDICKSCLQTSDYMPVHIFTDYDGIDLFASTDIHFLDCKYKLHSDIFANLKNIFQIDALIEKEINGFDIHKKISLDTELYCSLKNKDINCTVKTKDLIEDYITELQKNASKFAQE